MQPIDLIILSNGPGEITTWVRPVVKALRQELGDDHLRISLILSPCPNATGKEADIARSYTEIDRIQSAEHFFSFLVWGKTVDNWDWRERGVVIFLGGDQFYCLLIGKRLGYRTLVYAEWDARWYRWIDRFAAMTADVVKKIPPQYHHKFTVVGDLMADVSVQEKIDTQLRSAKQARTRSRHSRGASRSKHSNTTWYQDQQKQPDLIGLLPGSKAAKLSQGVPLCLAIAEYIYSQQPQIEFIIPVAPTLDLETLAKFADLQSNPVITKMGGVTAKLIISDAGDRSAYLETVGGVKIKLITEFPAHQFLSACRLCITTVGANTAELGSLAIPALVLIPTQQLDAMRSWDGIPGLLANLPGFGATFAKIINWLVLRKKRLYAWPNKWANQEIMPELVGELQANDIGEIVLGFLNHPEKLSQMRDRLRQIRGTSGAASRLAEIVIGILD